MVLAQVSGKIGNELQTFHSLDVSYPTLDILYPNAGRIVPNPWSIYTLPLFDLYPGPFKLSMLITIYLLVYLLIISIYTVTGIIYACQKVLYGIVIMHISNDMACIMCN